MNAKDIRHVIVKSVIPPDQISLYRALYFADQPLSIESIAHMIRHDDVKSMWGVIGALSNRIGDATSQSPKYRAFFDVQTKDGTYCFWMHPELREAIESIPELLEAMKLPVSKIYERYYREDYGLEVE